MKSFKNNLGVAIGFKNISKAFKLAAHLGSVVYLAVINNGVCPEAHRLSAPFNVYNRKAPMD